MMLHLVRNPIFFNFRDSTSMTDWTIKGSGTEEREEQRGRRGNRRFWLWRILGWRDLPSLRFCGRRWLVWSLVVV
jgi:hypothetical protein